MNNQFSKSRSSKSLKSSKTRTEDKKEDNIVDFTGYEAVDVLQALIDNVKPSSDFYYKLGKLDKESALSMIERKTIEYVNGRMLGVTFQQFPLMDSTKYDKHNGEGAMERALKLIYERTF